MVRYENDCCDCATSGYPCIGESCSKRNVKVLICDDCGFEMDELYLYDGYELCKDCLCFRYKQNREVIY